MKLDLIISNTSSNLAWSIIVVLCLSMHVAAYIYKINLLWLAYKTDTPKNRVTNIITHFVNIFIQNSGIYPKERAAIKRHPHKKK